MNSNYHHTSSGTGYIVNGDGTVTRQSNSSQASGKVGLWIFLIIFMITSIVLGILLYNAYDEARWETSRYSGLQTRYDSLEKTYKDLDSNYDGVKSYADRIPIIISEIEIVNVDKDGNEIYDVFGDIYDYKAEFLCPIIHYYSIHEQNITLNVCWYNSNGTLQKNDKSPLECTYTNTVHVYGGNNSKKLKGWGNVYHTSWPEGKYSVEIWYDDICLGVKHFEVY